MPRQRRTSFESEVNLRHNAAELATAKIPFWNPIKATTVPDCLAGFGHLFEFRPTDFPSSIYFLISDGIVVYVGQSVSMNERIAYHRKGGKIFDRIVYLPIPQSVLDLVESAFINILKPKYNLTAKGHHGVPIRLPEEKYAWIISQLLSPNITQPSFLEK